MSASVEAAGGFLIARGVPGVARAASCWFLWICGGCGGGGLSENRIWVEWGVRISERWWRVRALFSALRAGVLSFASPKESSQRKGDPVVGAPAGYLALLGEPGGSNELACGSNNANRVPPARLCCSAPSKGIRKASRVWATSDKTNATVAREAESLTEPGWFAGTLERCRATQGLAEKGRGLFEGRSPEFRSPRQSRVAQGTGTAGTDQGRLLFAYFFLAKQEKVRRPARAEPHANTELSLRSMPTKSSGRCRPTSGSGKPPFPEYKPAKLSPPLQCNITKP